MKRFITMIVVACAFFAVSAQNPMVTLSHDGELKFFTNLTALESAIDKAVTGDTIFLSEGIHILNGGSFEIPAGKRISIMGSGYNSYISGELIYQMTANSTKDSNSPLLDGLRIDNLTFKSGNTTVSSSYKGASEIKKCWIKRLSGGAYAGNNITYDRCYLEYAGFGGSGTVLVKNSKIRTAPGNAFASLVNIVNCHVDSAQYYPKTMISSILGGDNITAYETSDKPTYRIMNSILKSEPETYSQATVTTQDCFFWEGPQNYFDDKMEKWDPANIYWKQIKGIDGTEVGIYGGDSPFSENPSIPTVDTSTSSVEYDSSSNKLKVNITVKAD